jgi:hypothetical protein
MVWLVVLIRKRQCDSAGICVREASDDKREKTSWIDGSRFGVRAFDGNRVKVGAAFYGIDELGEFKLNWRARDPKVNKQRAGRK